MKILIIEDERPINNLIRSTLTADGYSCDCAFDGKEGADLIEQRQYDLILLDLMLPEISGYDLLEYIRSLGNIRAAQIPVIIISAMGQVQDRIRGLHLGADDYLCKPFQIGELAARVEAVLRRSGHSNEKIRIGDVLISPASRQVWKDGTPVELTVKEFDLLAELARHKNVVLSREKLYETVWQEEYTGETRTLDAHIQKLRKKLGWNGQIKTVFRIGYRLEEQEQ